MNHEAVSVSFDHDTVLTSHIRNMVSEMLKSHVRFFAVLALVPHFDSYSHFHGKLCTGHKYLLLRYKPHDISQFVRDVNQ